MYTSLPVHHDGFTDLLNTYALPTSLAQGYTENQNQNYNSPSESNISTGRQDKSESHQFECRYCNRFFSQNQTLKQHILTHTGQRPFECKICYKSFTQQGSLQRHLSTHTGARPFECTYCHLSFSQKNNLIRHVKIHTGAPKEFECQTCHRCFDRKRTLERHQQVHVPRDERLKVQCECCNREFKNREILRKHLKREESKLKGKEPEKDNEDDWLRQANNANRSWKHLIVDCAHCGKRYRRSTSVLSPDVISTSCLRCTAAGGSQVPWGIHKEVELLECGYCNKQFMQRNQFQKHMDTHIHREDYKFECAQCHIRFKTKGLLKRHTTVQHDTGNNQCHLCGLNFKFISKLKAHYYLCHAEELGDDLDDFVTLYGCAHCERVCYTRDQINHHIKRHMKNWKPPKKEIETENDISAKKSSKTPSHFLESYLYIPNKDRCPDERGSESEDDVAPMDDDFFSPIDFLEKPPPKDQPFFCYVCKRTYSSMATLRQHFQTEHEEHDDFECEYCAKSFRSKNSLYKHKLTHRPDKFKCEKCDKSFGRKFSLTTHMLTHSEKSVKCPFCPKAFYMKPQLRTHLKTHRGEKNFECGVCNKKFYDLTRLNRHHLTHTGERKFTCHICQLAFIQKNHLDKHLVRHEEVENRVTFPCEMCEKVFYRKDNYVRHRAKHDEKRKTYTCPMCDKKFLDKYIMQRHVEGKKCAKSRIKEAKDDVKKRKKKVEEQSKKTKTAKNRKEGKKKSAGKMSKEKAQQGTRGRKKKVNNDEGGKKKRKTRKVKDTDDESEVESEKDVKRIKIITVKLERDDNLTFSVVANVDEDGEGIDTKNGGNIVKTLDESYDSLYQNIDENIKTLNESDESNLDQEGEEDMGHSKRMKSVNNRSNIEMAEAINRISEKGNRSKEGIEPIHDSGEDGVNEELDINTDQILGT